MQILSRKEFLLKPIGTLYAKYESIGSYGDLCIKEKTIDDDWYYYYLFATDLEDNEEFNDFLLNAEKDSSIEIPHNITTLYRDGMFNNDEKFLVFNKKELKSLIDFLCDFL